MNSTNLLNDIELRSPETIELDEEQIERAMQLSGAISDPIQQWQTYLNTLALFGFEQWLNQHSVSFERSHSQQTRVIPAVCNLQVNGFRLCLIPAESQPDEEVFIPRAATQPELAAHCYVTLAIYEEQAQVSIHSFLRYDQLASRLSALPLEDDDTYAVPLNWFDTEPDRLLLYLRCAQPTAIPLPLTSESVQHSALGELVQELTQPLVNASLWLENQLDSLARELSWVLLPAIATNSALRSVSGSGSQLSYTAPAEELESLLRQMERSGISLPPQIGVAYRDWLMASIPLRLYAVSGALPESTTPEWMLLLILGAQPNAELPIGISLQISTPSETVAEQTLQNRTDGDFLIAQVIGSWDETFSVTITLPEGTSLKLPTFAFQPDK